MGRLRLSSARAGIVVFAMALAIGGLSGCGGDDDDAADMAMGAGGEGGGGDDIPAEFADLSNPFNGDADALAAGQTLYGACAGCHGSDGAGSPAFVPPATDFTGDQSAWTDGYLFWRIRTGAASGPAGSVMPAYEASQTEDETWQVITYLRSFGS